MSKDIKSNLISPKQALDRNVRREKEKAMKMLMSYANIYLIDLGKAGNDMEAVEWVFERQSQLWRKYVQNWNLDPSRFSELREYDFEDFVKAHLIKIGLLKPEKKSITQKAVDLVTGGTKK